MRHEETRTGIDVPAGLIGHASQGRDEAAEALLTQRLDLAPQLLARVQPDAAKTGLTVHAVEVKDVMLPAELKRAFGDVLKAKQEGQAALERARGESASLRNLANAARVLEGNPALMNLRVHPVTRGGAERWQHARARDARRFRAV